MKIYDYITYETPMQVVQFLNEALKNNWKVEHIIKDYFFYIFYSKEEDFEN